MVCQTVSGSRSSSDSSSSTEASMPQASLACLRSAAVTALSKSRQTSGVCLFLLWRYDGNASWLHMRSSSWLASELPTLLLPAECGFRPQRTPARPGTHPNIVLHYLCRTSGRHDALDQQGSLLLPFQQQLCHDAVAREGVPVSWRRSCLGLEFLKDV